MNYQELEKKILELSEMVDENGKHRFDEYTLENEDMMRILNSELVDNFNDVRRSRQKWHQFVREIFWPYEELKFIKEDLCDLILEYRKSYADYFKLRKNEKIYALPDRVSEIARLISLHEKFYKIYKNIIRNIHFENPINENYSKNVNGKINWGKTLQMSKTEFPTYFYSQTWERKFHNSGNILLILCVKWQQKLTNKILHVHFSDELTKKELESLNQVLIKTKKSLENFPFYDVIRESNKYEHLDVNHRLIQNFKNQLHKEIKQKIIKNYEYQKLLEWIEEFEKLHFSGLNELTSDFALEFQKDIDLAYEGWVFWKLVSIFYDKHYLKKIVMSENEQFFEFIHDEKEIRVYHEKKIQGYAKEQKQDPDYSVFIKPYNDEDLLCIFDAKNSRRLYGEQKDKINSYKENLQCRFGGLIFNGNDEEKNAKLYSTKEYFTDSEKIEKRKLDVDRKTWHFALRAKPNSDEKNKLVLNKIHDEIISEIEAIQ
tara:strand:+ start:2868 stop:4328 length:1461 start_codon:yes stop_codon:yes gene_type:complete